MQKSIFIASACTLAFAMGGTAAAQDASGDAYQDGAQIQVMLGFKPGGGSDTLAQLIQPYLADRMNVNFVNEYIPGAAGAIAWTRLANQTNADGSTISITNTPMITTNYIMNPSVSYTLDEIQPIANIITDPGIVVVNADSEFNSLDDLVNAAKENPASVTVGNSGVGGDDYFSSLQFENVADVELQKVPFQGDGPSATAAMSGKIDASFTNVGIAYPMINSGDLKALAVFSDERLEQLPDVPTATELGYDLVAGSSRGYAAPAGFPDDKREALVDAMAEITSNEDFLEQARSQAINIDFQPTDEYTEMLERQEAEYTDIWAAMKKAGETPQ